MLLMHGCQQGVSFGEVRIQLQCFSSSAHYLCAGLFGGSADKNCANLPKGLCQTNVGRCKRRISVGCFLKVAYGLVDVGSGVTFVQGEAASKITLVDLGGDGTRCFKPLMFFTGDRNLDLPSNGFRYVALESERIPKFTIVGFRPKVLVSRSANQLVVDANAATLSHDRSFDKSIYPKRFGNFWR